jgi:toxin ParE1/3/4
MIPVWSPEAIDDLAALRAYIERDNPAAAQRVVLRIIHSVETLLPNNSDFRIIRKSGYPAASRGRANL